MDEVVAVFDRYYVPYIDEIQGLFVDKAGNSVIVEGNEMIYKQGDFQVVTNFLQSQPELGGYPCCRYDTATAMLEQMTEFSLDYFMEICSAVYFDEIPLSTFMLDTIYSYTCDLTNGRMYLYFFHDYAHVMEIKLPEIFDYGYQQYDLPSLFLTNASHIPDKPGATPLASPSPLPTFPISVGITPLGTLTFGLTPIPTSVGPRANSFPVGCDDAQFIGETVPDKTEFDANKEFTKAWSMQNVGTCTWDEGYTFAFKSGERLSGNYIKITKESDFTKPGGSQAFVVKLQAPKSVGEFIGYWQMRNDAGVWFGSLVSVYIIVE